MVEDRGSLRQLGVLLLRFTRTNYGLVLKILCSLTLVSLMQASVLFILGPLLKSFHSPEARIAIPDWLVNYKGIVEQFMQYVSQQPLYLFLPIALILLASVRAVASFVFEKSQAQFSLLFATEIRERLFEGLLHSPYRFIVSKPVGSWMSVILNDVMFLQSRVSEIAVALVRDLTMVTMAMAALIYLEWRSAIILCFLLPLAAFILGRFSGAISRFAGSWQQELARMSAYVLDVRQRFEFMKAQHGEDCERHMFGMLNRNYYSSIRRSLLVRSAFAPMVEWFGVITFAVAISVVFSEWGQRNFDGTSLLQLFVALGLMVRPLRNIGEQLTRIHEVEGGLREAMSCLRDFAEHKKKAVLRLSSSTLEFMRIDLRDVGYSISETMDITLNQLEINPGSSIAVIGPSGMGKSTIVKLLAALLPAKRWDANFTQIEVAAMVSLVSQEPFLFSDSIDENLNYGLKEKADAIAITEALDLVNLREFVEHLPLGMATKMTAIGSKVSGGQLQRLALARAWLRSFRILLLDEATSALDHDNEVRITKSIIERLRASGRSLIAVTHRTTCLHMYDQIWFVEAGRVQFKGTPSEIMSIDRVRLFLSTLEQE